MSKPTSEQMMAGYAVACRFGVLEARAFDLAEQMWIAMSTAAGQETMNENRGLRAATEKMIECLFGIQDDCNYSLTEWEKTRDEDCLLDGLKEASHSAMSAGSHGLFLVRNAAKFTGKEPE